MSQYVCLHENQHPFTTLVWNTPHVSQHYTFRHEEILQLTLTVSLPITASILPPPLGPTVAPLVQPIALVSDQPKLHPSPAESVHPLPAPRPSSTPPGPTLPAFVARSESSPQSSRLPSPRPASPSTPTHASSRPPSHPSPDTSAQPPSALSPSSHPSSVGPTNYHSWAWTYCVLHFNLDAKSPPYANSSQVGYCETQNPIVSCFLH